MKFAVVGGDARAALLAGLLLRDGHRVRSFALEKGELPAEIPRDSCLQACAYGADAVLLPVPAEAGPLLNTPLSDRTVPLAELWSSLWPGQLAVGGRFSEQSAAQALREKLRLADLLQRADFVTANAALTAEAAAGLLIRESGRALQGSRCLILGFGRIGKLLARKLAALGVSVSVAARREPERALAEALGYTAFSFPQAEAAAGDFDIIVNTVPAGILSDAALCCLPPEALLLELASPPGGFDRQLAENIGLRALAAPGLPGTWKPLAAAELLRRCVYEILREQED